ncbi:hypothetical protein R1flu_005395 [Riccia fluitans]|uniref:Uncharacterized protein n=1 Tax=Riccia fluitans TaxID=41844 RepID=A0ABD1YT24_9MARC
MISSMSRGTLILRFTVYTFQQGGFARVAHLQVSPVFVSSQQLAELTWRIPVSSCANRADVTPQPHPKSGFQQLPKIQQPEKDLTVGKVREK